MTLRWILLGTLLTTAAAVNSETRWISDELRVPLRSGPSNNHTILHRGLPAGTRMEVLERDTDAGFARIRTSRGTEGWVPIQYLVAEPIARDRLPALQREISRLETTVAELRGNLTTVTSNRDETSNDNASLREQVASLETELGEVRRISREALEQHAESQRLIALNERLRNELEDLGVENSMLRDNLQQRWLLIGAGLVLAGLLLGVLIKSRPRRSAWS
ncbi:MAG: TIGR04211 family SH3 domain-containing protein [Pseudomonadales bacterium]|jgi:SH3 domain protein|nr:TIGR04211 family SH3 domain-containing protein [Pseudomonadales bacterium]MDP6472042.1 TIGR04211 family SH3 domain-containing protein [Pseudomonadales bacterium]MDP6826685.1 TIGR04211 family SH3 domain-containing protein [Pseudomonadales bacterium]MDP6969954.1 TIGR04211 family SH3 domain-containing protein [Pseudomonadales bacterium]|tara:strand:- start:897 stop:1556 length:660 start_codon:yes stop_codon:yes gene_type:complete